MIGKILVPKGRYVVAVSGGVDSVVLLDILSYQLDLELIVAHFDHGIRNDSAMDAAFVAELANKYDLRFETKREELGPDVSEALARKYRYNFLQEITNKYNAKLITAHHADDVVETIAINLSRGTGWRGLAVLDSDVIRPLTCVTKLEILDYANKHNLKWHEDSTNLSDKYLRNRIRKQTKKMNYHWKQELLNLWIEQKRLKRLIDSEIFNLVGDGPIYSRYFFISLDFSVGAECLRRVVKARLTRPQLINTLYAIKTALPNKTYYAGNDVVISFTSRNFTVELLK
ncbi:MAG: tRNA(Ile)-lysidine synthase [Patescibacteria group bacterium]|nr:tRNA(Ile)-lysidine synthase [Patescibacteria group bacterium]